MGARYLTDLANVCWRAGYPVIEVEGWQTRARGSGGYNDGKPDHVCIHHTGSPPSSDGWPDVNYCTYNDDDAPLCNLYLSRVGEIYVCAAGATNTNGTGDCPHLSPDTMNSSAIGIEANNHGGHPWPEVQQDAYLALVAVLCDAYGIPHAHVESHAEWAPSRKVDPAGESSWAAGTATWDMYDFRDDLAGGSTGGPRIDGIDVSKWQGVIDWPTVQASAGITWAACRVWDRDIGGPDPQFTANRAGMAFARHRLLYHWLQPGLVEVGVDQVMSTVGALADGEGIMCDAEEDGITEAEVLEFCELIEARTGRPVAVYTGGYVAGGTIWHSGNIFNGHRPRIFAAYTSESEARDQHADGIAWDAWQWSSTGKVPGINGNVDLDQVDDAAAFDACCGITTGGEEDMAQVPQEEWNTVRDRIMGSLPGEYSTEQRGLGGDGDGIRRFAMDDQDGNYIVSMLQQVMAEVQALRAESSK